MNDIVVIQIFRRTDVVLPEVLQRSMAAQVEATQEAKGKKIHADGELKSARAVYEAAEKLKVSPAAMAVSRDYTFFYKIYLQDVLCISGPILTDAQCNCYRSKFHYFVSNTDRR